VAKRYNVAAAQVARWNKVRATSQFKAGTTIVVYVPSRPVTRVASAKSGTRPAARPVMRASATPKASPVRMSRK
jgi:membrane-bound lytic murein transglycosylase D